MKNLVELFGTIALTAVIGLAFTACDNDTSGGGGGNQYIQFITDNGILKFSQSGDTIRIPAGIYNVKRGIYDRHIYLDGLSNVIIDATNVTFIFDDIFYDGLFIHNCVNLTVKGAKLLFKNKSFTQGTITQVGANYVHFQLDDGYPKPSEIGNENNQWIMGIIYYNGFIKSNTYNLFDLDGTVEELGGGEYKLDDNWYQTANISIGDKIALRPQYAYMTIATIFSENVTFDEIQILSGVFAFFEDSGKGGHKYINCSVKPLDNGDLLSTAADAFHSTNVEIGPLIDSCLFERMGDDGVNIHGMLYNVATGGTNTFTIDNIIGRNWVVPFNIGDILRIYRNDTEINTPQLKVTAVNNLGSNKFSITADSNVTIQNGDLVFTPNRVGAGFTIVNTTVKNNHARGLVIKSRDGIITNCTIEGSSMYGILVDTEINGGWNESMYAENITISNCTINNVNFTSNAPSKEDIFIHHNTRNVIIQ